MYFNRYCSLFLSVLRRLLVVNYMAITYHKDIRITQRSSHLSGENLRRAISVPDKREDGCNPVTLENIKKCVIVINA